jgi:hypothetical protein
MILAVGNVLFLDRVAAVITDEEHGDMHCRRLRSA